MAFDIGSPQRSVPTTGNFQGTCCSSDCDQINAKKSSALAPTYAKCQLQLYKVGLTWEINVHTITMRNRATRSNMRGRSGSTMSIYMHRPAVVRNHVSYTYHMRRPKSKFAYMSASTIYVR